VNYSGWQHFLDDGDLRIPVQGVDSARRKTKKAAS